MDVFCYNRKKKKEKKLYKIFNENTVKISYSCKRNMASIISAHNSSFGYNCRNKSYCLLEEKCLTPKVIYHADVANDVDDKYKFYYGLTETSFKEKLETIPNRLIIDDTKTKQNCLNLSGH